MSGPQERQLEMMAEAFGDEVAVIDLGSEDQLRFADWEARANRLARWLVSAGVAPGDRVALHLPADEALVFLVAYAAVHKAGAVAVPTSTRLVARELHDILGHAGATVAISGEATTPVLLDADVPGLGLVVSTDPAIPGTVAYDHAFADDASAFQVPIGDDDVADLMYTSGTTGRPKGVVVRHRSSFLMPNALPRWSGHGWLHSSPMFTFAGIASVYSPMKLGMRLEYLTRFDAGRWIDIVEHRRPASVFLVPAMVELLLDHPDFAEADLSSVTMCSVGSAPISPASLATLREKLVDASVSNAWGMTEAGPAYCFMPKEEQERRVGSVGKPLPPTEFRIVDDDGNELPAGDVGELLVRNPGREREYWRDPEATHATWQDGWLHSGDDARLDDDGYLYIVGRRKDVIIRGGNNVHAAEVESVLAEHPDVAQAAVAAVPHDVLGEDVGAWIVARRGTGPLDVEQLRAFAAERLADYKVPRHFTFVDDLPRNATGKVVKADLPAASPRRIVDGDPVADEPGDGREFVR